MSSRFSHLPTPVAHLLASYASRKRIISTIRIWAVSLAVYLAAALLAMHIDRFTFLDTTDRALLFWSITLLSLGYAAIATGILYWRQPSVREIAYEVEGASSSQLEERFVTLDSILRSPLPAQDDVARELCEQLRSKAVEQAESLTAARLARDPKLRGAIRFLGILILIYSALCLPDSYQFPLMAKRFFMPYANLQKPSFIQISVSPQNAVIGHGNEIIIQADIEGSLPAWLSPFAGWLGMKTDACLIRIVPAATDQTHPGGRERLERMSRIQRRLFLHTQERIETSFDFQVRCGDAQTAVFPVEVVMQPKIQHLSLEITPPPYSGLPTETLTNLQHPIALLKGSQAVVRMKTDQAVPVREIRAEKIPEPFPLDWDEATHSGSLQHEFTSPVTFSIYVENEKGFANLDPHRIQLTLREDRRPTVTVLDPTVPVDAVPGELVPLQLKLEDDLGIDSAVMRFQMNPTVNPDAPFQEIPLELPETPGKELTIPASFDLDKAGTVPGDELLVEVRTRDSGGNDGVSRPIMVRIVAFTRGEHERRRIKALNVLQTALAKASEEFPVNGTARFRNSSWSTILEQASRNGITLGKSPDVETLLQWMEREHHFTESSLDKNDLRLVHGILASTKKPVMLDPTGKVLSQIANTSLPALIRYRQMKNLVLRLYGMRAEAENIHTRIRDLIKQEEQGEGAEKVGKRKTALRRRTTLYLKTLQDIGDELLELARTTETLDAKQLATIQGDLNTDAYYLKRGSLAKNLTACDAVISRLDHMLQIVPSALPETLAAWHTARTNIASEYNKQLAANGADAHWLETQYRLCERNPFTPLWTRYRLQVLIHGAPQETIAAFAEQNKSAIALDATIQRTLESESTIARARSFQGIGATELHLTIGLNRAERMQADEAQRYLQNALSDSKDISSPTPAQMPHASASFVQYIDRLAPLTDFARSHIPAYSAKDSLHSLMQESEACSGAFAALYKQSNLTQESIAAQLPDALQKTDALREHFMHSLQQLMINLRFLRIDSPDTEQWELLRLRLQKIYEMHRARSEPILGSISLSTSGAMDAGQLEQMRIDANRLKGIFASLQKNLSAILTPPADSSSAQATQLSDFSEMPLLVESRDFYTITRTLPYSDSPSAEAQAFIDTHPAVGKAYLALLASRIQDIESQLSEAQTLLTTTPFDAAAYSASLQAGENALQTLVADVKRSGKGDDQSRLVRALDAYQRQLQGLGLQGSTSPLEVRKRILAFPESISALRSLQRDFAALSQTDKNYSRLLKNGPEGIEDDSSRLDAEEIHRQLLFLWEFSRIHSIQSLMNASSQDSTPEALFKAHAWAHFGFHLLRSPLSGAPHQKPPQATESKTDRFIEWLRKELEDARKRQDLKHYLPETREYLDSMSDYLRY